MALRALTRIDPLRLRALNRGEVNPQGDYVLYWMVATRRLHFSHPLQRAVAWARELEKPLLILEALRLGYPWASDRLHRFILDGVAEKEHALRDGPVFYFPYVELERDQGKGLLAALAARACLVVTDEFPCFMLPHLTAAGARQCRVLLEAVDGNGVLPLRAAGRVHLTARSFRALLQKWIREHLAERAAADPLRSLRLPRLRRLPDGILDRWPRAPRALLDGEPAALAALPIDHSVAPTSLTGGERAAVQRWREFRRRELIHYAESRRLPDRGSGLSPYLHFGHIAAEQMLREVLGSEEWSEERLSSFARGGREGFWGLSPGAEAFLDQLLTWRELGFNFCTYRPEDYDRFESLPDWARRTLEGHARDRRSVRYALADLSEGTTEDELWNACQHELRVEGRMASYLRMVWGKRILEWTASPEEALQVMTELNNKYALDGRDPNSYSGIFWVLGRYDRPFGPERPIFGKVRYMSTAATRRKLDLRAYLERHLGTPPA